MEKTKKIIVKNRRARHEYFVEDTVEAGLALFGTEVKSIRQGKANLTDAYVRVRNQEAFLVGMHVSPYEQGNIFNREPLRDRKLLLHKREIRELESIVAQKGLTLVPLSLYFLGNHLKLEIGICRGKKLYDKREALKQQQDQREIARETARRERGEAERLEECGEKR